MFNVLCQVTTIIILKIITRISSTNGLIHIKCTVQLQQLSVYCLTYLHRAQRYRGPGSSVGVTIGYGLDVRGSNSGGGEIFRTCPDRPWGPPSLLYNGYRVFPGVKSGQGVTLTPHPLLVPWSRKGRAIPLLPL